MREPVNQDLHVPLDAKRTQEILDLINSGPLYPYTVRQILNDNPLHSLARYRYQSGLTQEKLSQILGIEKHIYQYWENGFNEIPSKYVTMLCDYFSITHVQFYTELTKAEKDLFIEEAQKRRTEDRRESKRKEVMEMFESLPAPVTVSAMAKALELTEHAVRARIRDYIFPVLSCKNNVITHIEDIKGQEQVAEEIKSIPEKNAHTSGSIRSRLSVAGLTFDTFVTDYLLPNKLSVEEKMAWLKSDNNPKEDHYIWSAFDLYLKQAALTIAPQKTAAKQADFTSKEIKLRLAELFLSIETFVSDYLIPLELAEEHEAAIRQWFDSETENSSKYWRAFDGYIKIATGEAPALVIKPKVHPELTSAAIQKECDDLGIDCNDYDQLHLKSDELKKEHSEAVREWFASGTMESEYYATSFKKVIEDYKKLIGL